MITLYGINNCDTVKKAQKWIEAHDLAYQFHDFKTQGLSEKLLRQWVTSLGYETLLNRRSTTWRKLPEETRNQMDEKLAIKAMLDHPTLIKRPVIDTGAQLSVGFNPSEYMSILL